MRKLLYLSFILSMTGIFQEQVYAQATPEAAYATIVQLTPFHLYGAITRHQITTFSADDLIAKGLDKDAKAALTNSFIPFTEAANKFVREQIKLNKAPKEYDQYIVTLDKTRDFIVNEIEKLHKAFENKSLQTSGLTKDKVEIEGQLERVTPLMIIDTMTQGIAVPTSWSSKVPQDIKKIMPSYLQLIKDWQLAQPITLDDQADYFFRVKNFVKNEAEAKRFIDILDQLIYRLDQDLRSLASLSGSAISLDRSKLSDQLAALRQMRSFLKKLYPQIISTLQRDQFPNTSDKPSMIIFAQAASYESILERLLKNINQYISQSNK